MPSRAFAAVGIIAVLAASHPAAGQSPSGPPPTCDSIAAYQQLDFWVGEWDVFAGDQVVGTNTIEKILSGCAIVENWTDANGSEGKSLIYYEPVAGTWKQVWVTQQAAVMGGTREKTLIEHLEGGAVRFQGELRAPEGHPLPRPHDPHASG